MRRVLVVLLAVLTAAATFTVAAAPVPAGAATGDSWQPRNAPPGEWKAVATSSTRFVAVGASGQAMYSDDGTTWVRITDGDVTAGSPNWTSVAHGGGRFVMVADEKVVWSDNGVSWSDAGDPDLDLKTWTSVTYGNGKFVAVAENAAVYSTDGDDWTTATQPKTGPWVSVTYGGTRFVAVGTNAAMYSNDGNTWLTPNGLPVGSWRSVTYGGTKFVAVATNQAAVAIDGSDWHAASGPQNGAWASVTHTGGRFVAVGNGAVSTSTDGESWTLRPDAPTAGWKGVVYRAGDGLLVAVADGGADRVMTSTDGGITWTGRAAAAHIPWRGVAFGGGRFVAVTENQVLTSTDAVVWTVRTVPTGQWRSVAYGEGTFVAVGDDDKVMTSPTGQTWTLQTPPTPSTDHDWKSVAFGDDTFVAVAVDRVMFSTDGGETWTDETDAPVNAGAWTSVAYGNGGFVAVGADKAMRTDGGPATWAAATGAVPLGQWKSVAFGGGAFVAVDTADAMRSTNGGATWAPASTGPSGGSTLVSVAYSGRFVAVGNDGTVAISDTGDEWDASTTPVPLGSWQAVTYAPDMLVAVGSSATTNHVMTSGTLFGAPTITSFAPESGPVGTTVTILGTNFLGAVGVNFGAAIATDVEVVSDTEIRAKVPTGAATGRIEVTTVSGTATSATDFVVADSDRIYGQDAIDTSMAISQRSFGANEAAAVVLARADFFADALAGGPLAARRDGPLLINPGGPSSTLDTRVRTEILRVLEPGKTVYILGGPLALGTGIDTALTNLGYVVTRVYGQNQFATAVAIANEIGGTPGAILEATGWNFPDALSAVPAAIQLDGVIVLTNDNVQAPETQAYINGKPGVPRFTIGGNLVAGGADPGATNVSGVDLWATSAAVATRWFADAPVYGVATGATFPDALSGGVFMATGGRMGPVVLVAPSLPVPSPITAYLDTLDPGTPGYVFGGPLAISDAVVVAVKAAVG